MSDKKCISCGMPIRTEADVAGEDTGKPYCHHCTGADGTLKSYAEVLEGMTAFMVQTQGLDESVAQGMAAEMMGKLPAWAER